MSNYNTIIFGSSLNNVGAINAALDAIQFAEPEMPKHARRGWGHF